MCPHDSVDSRQEWVPTPPNYKVALSVYIIFNRRHTEHISATVNAEVKALTSENTRDSSTLTYTNRSVVQCNRCVGLYGQLKWQDSGAFVATRSSLTVAVTKALSWLRSQDYTQAS